MRLRCKLQRPSEDLERTRVAKRSASETVAELDPRQTRARRIEHVWHYVGGIAARLNGVEDGSDQECSDADKIAEEIDHAEDDDGDEELPGLTDDEGEGLCIGKDYGFDGEHGGAQFDVFREGAWTGSLSRWVMGRGIREKKVSTTILVFVNHTIRYIDFSKQRRPFLNHKLSLIAVSQDIMRNGFFVMDHTVGSIHMTMSTVELPCTVENPMHNGEGQHRSLVLLALKLGMILPGGSDKPNTVECFACPCSFTVPLFFDVIRMDDNIRNELLRYRINLDKSACVEFEINNDYSMQNIEKLRFKGKEPCVYSQVTSNILCHDEVHDRTFKSYEGASYIQIFVCNWDWFTKKLLMDECEEIAERLGHSRKTKFSLSDETFRTKYLESACRGLERTILILSMDKSRKTGKFVVEDEEVDSHIARLFHLNEKFDFDGMLVAWQRFISERRTEAMQLEILIFRMVMKVMIVRERLDGVKQSEEISMSLVIQRFFLTMTHISLFGIFEHVNCWFYKYFESIQEDGEEKIYLKRYDEKYLPTLTQRICKDEPKLEVLIDEYNGMFSNMFRAWMACGCLIQTMDVFYNEDGTPTSRMKISRPCLEWDIVGQQWFLNLCGDIDSCTSFGKPGVGDDVKEFLKCHPLITRLGRMVCASIKNIPLMSSILDTKLVTYCKASRDIDVTTFYGAHGDPAEIARMIREHNQHTDLQNVNNRPRDTMDCFVMYTPGSYTLFHVINFIKESNETFEMYHRLMTIFVPADKVLQITYVEEKYYIVLITALVALFVAHEYTPFFNMYTRDIETLVPDEQIKTTNAKKAMDEVFSTFNRTFTDDNDTLSDIMFRRNCSELLCKVTALDDIIKNFSDESVRAGDLGNHIQNYLGNHGAYICSLLHMVTMALETPIFNTQLALDISSEEDSDRIFDFYSNYESPHDGRNNYNSQKHSTAKSKNYNRFKSFYNIPILRKLFGNGFRKGDLGQQSMPVFSRQIIPIFTYCASFLRANAKYESERHGVPVMTTYNTFSGTIKRGEAEILPCRTYLNILIGAITAKHDSDKQFFSIDDYVTKYKSRNNSELYSLDTKKNALVQSHIHSCYNADLIDVMNHVIVNRGETVFEENGLRVPDGLFAEYNEVSHVKTMRGALDWLEIGLHLTVKSKKTEFEELMAAETPHMRMLKYSFNTFVPREVATKFNMPRWKPKTYVNNAYRCDLSDISLQLNEVANVLLIKSTFFNAIEPTDVSSWLKTTICDSSLYNCFNKTNEKYILNAAEQVAEYYAENGNVQEGKEGLVMKQARRAFERVMNVHREVRMDMRSILFLKKETMEETCEGIMCAVLCGPQDGDGYGANYEHVMKHLIAPDNDSDKEMVED